MLDDGEESLLDINKLKYALYVRKSTDDKGRQQRSIEDQITECEETAARLGITLIKPYYEDHRSAKTPKNRPEYDKMMSDLSLGKFDAIMAWHPDRLARNMQEGGDIIGLVDQKKIKDLKFVTHFFTNDASGKMLLGISFVLSKYYSDDLSQKVTRGLRQGFKEGKSSGTPKHGYIRTEQGLYVPDGKNFNLIVEAWQMRKQGISYQEIANWLNGNGYVRIIKDKKSKGYGNKIGIDFRTLPNVFKDPFYYGVLVQASKSIDLRVAYDFNPAVSEEDFNEVQRLTRATVSPIIQNRRKTFYPLRGMVKCSYCHHSMSPGAVTSRLGKKYLYYRCDTKDCERKKKSIRAIVIFKFIYNLLSNGLELTEKDYKNYYDYLVNQSRREIDKIQIDLNSKNGALKAVKRRRDDIALKIINYAKNTPVWKVNNKQLLKLSKEIETLELQIRELRALQASPEEQAMSIEQFLNLAKQAGSKVKAANEVGKDHICRIIFLNLVVDEEKVVDYHLTKAFEKLEKLKSFGYGGGTWI